MRRKEKINFQGEMNNCVWAVPCLILATVYCLLPAVHTRQVQISRGQGLNQDSKFENPEEALRNILRYFRLGGAGIELPTHGLYPTSEKAPKRARFGPQRTIIGSEFLGKRSYDDEAEAKRMGSEFLGKREAYYEPRETKRMGSEFLGKRMGSEFLGKRMGSEFLGKRMGSEFLGKRVGSEFLGKRSMESEERSSEDLGVDPEDLQKRMGSEFLGKRDEVKRMGSEFLGRKKRWA